MTLRTVASRIEFQFQLEIVRLKKEKETIGNPGPSKRLCQKNKQTKKHISFFKSGGQTDLCVKNQQREASPKLVPASFFGLP